MNTWMTWNWCNVYEDILVLFVIQASWLSPYGRAKARPNGSCLFVPEKKEQCCILISSDSVLTCKITTYGYGMNIRYMNKGAF